MKKITITCIAILTIAMTHAQNTSFKTPPEWSKNANIYEVNIRQYTPEGTINAFAEHLSRLKNMGVDILWLMPVQPIGEKNRKGGLGSYYSIQNYTAINPEFGSMKDFKNLVKAAHKLDMYIVLDWVANHTAWDHEWIKKNPEWYSKDGKGDIKSPEPDWSDVADLNYDKPEMRAAMLAEMKYWITEADIDGFRCDVAYLVPFDFWTTAVKEFQAIKPEIFMLAEGEGPEFHRNGFDMTYTWSIHHTLGKITRGEATVAQLDSILQGQLKLFPADAYRMQFTSNHDENSWKGSEFERMGEGFKACFVLASTIPGMPLMYSGQEAGLNKRLRFFEKDTIPFADGVPHENFYGTMLKLKHENSALWNGSYGGSFNVLSNDDNMYVFVREREKDKLVVLINLNNAAKEIKIESDLLVGTYTNVFTGESMKLKSKVNMEIPAFGYFVWSK